MASSNPTLPGRDAPRLPAAGSQLRCLAGTARFVRISSRETSTQRYSAATWLASRASISARTRGSNSRSVLDCIHQWIEATDQKCRDAEIVIIEHCIGDLIRCPDEAGGIALCAGQCRDAGPESLVEPAPPCRSIEQAAGACVRRRCAINSILPSVMWRAAAAALLTQRGGLGQYMVGLCPRPDHRYPLGRDAARG